jgi:hypothetical protein
VGAIRATYIAWGLGGGVLLGVLTALTVRSPRYTLQMISFALVAGMLAAAVAYRLPAKFTSTAVMRISRAQLPFHSTDPAPPLPTVQRFEQLKSAVLSDANLRRIVLMPDLDLYRDERGGKPISGIVSQMRSRDISIVPASSSGLPANTAPDFLIRFTYPDKRKAQRVVMRLVRGFVDANLADERTLYSETNDETVRAILDRKVGETLVVLDPPSDPQMPVGPPRLYIALAGIGVGLLLGVLLLRKRGPSEPVPQPA